MAHIVAVSSRRPRTGLRVLFLVTLAGFVALTGALSFFSDVSFFQTLDFFLTAGSLFASVSFFLLAASLPRNPPLEGDRADGSLRAMVVAPLIIGGVVLASVIVAWIGFSAVGLLGEGYINRVVTILPVCSAVLLIIASLGFICLIGVFTRRVTADALVVGTDVLAKEKRFFMKPFSQYEKHRFDAVQKVHLNPVRVACTDSEFVLDFRPLTITIDLTPLASGDKRVGFRISAFDREVRRWLEGVISERAAAVTFGQLLTQGWSAETTVERFRVSWDGQIGPVTVWAQELQSQQQERVV